MMPVARAVPKDGTLGDSGTGGVDGGGGEKDAIEGGGCHGCGNGSGAAVIAGREALGEGGQGGGREGSGASGGAGGHV